MSAGSDKRAPAAVGVSEVDLAGECLLEAISTSCDSGVGFAVQVQAALAAALALSVAEPALARRLTVEPYLGDQVTFRAQQRWRKRYGAILREAAGKDPELPVNPDFLEPVLIGGLCFQISRRILAGRSDRLPELLPGFLSFILSYYLAPPQANPVIRAAREASR